MRKVSGATGRYYPCCWTECDRDGLTEYEQVVKEPKRYIHYLFCSERCREYWRHSHIDLWNLPSGSKTLGGPVQGVTLPPRP